jgi:transposase
MEPAVIDQLRHCAKHRGIGVFPATLNRTGFVGGSNSWEGGAMTSKTTNKFSPEVRDRAVRLVLDREPEHGARGAAVVSIAGKIGCTAQTLNERVKKAERDGGKPGLTSDRMARVNWLPRSLLHSAGRSRGALPRHVESSSNGCVTRTKQPPTRPGAVQNMLETGRYGTIKEIARAEKINASYVSRVLRLTLLGPSIVEAILHGRQPAGMTMAQMANPFDVIWHGQQMEDVPRLGKTMTDGIRTTVATPDAVFAIHPAGCRRPSW